MGKNKETTLCSWCSKEIKKNPVNYNGEFICVKCWERRRKESRNK